MLLRTLPDVHPLTLAAWHCVCARPVLFERRSDGVCGLDPTEIEGERLGHCMSAPWRDGAPCFCSGPRVDEVGSVFSGFSGLAAALPPLFCCRATKWNDSGCRLSSNRYRQTPIAIAIADRKSPIASVIRNRRLQSLIAIAHCIRQLSFNAFADRPTQS